MPQFRSAAQARFCVYHACWLRSRSRGRKAAGLKAARYIQVCLESCVPRAVRFAYNCEFAGTASPSREGVRGPTGELMILDVNEIQKILPHRYPFLFVDAIVEMERLKRVVGIKNVTINESYFQGHFPGQPIMPGVLIIEAMAQTGGLLLLQEVPDREKKLLYFVAVDGARFRRPVVPGDQLKVEMKVLSWRGDFCKLDGRATVDGQLAAEATLMCKMVDRVAAPEPEKALR
jgi:3-hydroxyacyl-[acyl-carrier-protein] dehydratase